MTKKCITLGLLFALLSLSVSLQAQIVGVHTNALGWVTATPNIGLEVAFAKNWSIEVDGGFNPFSFNNGKKTNLYAIQSEVKFWPHYKFTGHFIGIHGHYAAYDWGLWKYRYKGDLGGCGISYGYSWIIHKRWNVEATIGAGWNLIRTEQKYDRCDPKICYGPDVHGHWGLTKIGVKFTYLIK